MSPQPVETVSPNASRSCIRGAGPRSARRPVPWTIEKYAEWVENLQFRRNRSTHRCRAGEEFGAGGGFWSCESVVWRRSRLGGRHLMPVLAMQPSACSPTAGKLQPRQATKRSKRRLRAYRLRNQRSRTVRHSGRRVRGARNEHIAEWESRHPAGVRLPRYASSWAVWSSSTTTSAAVTLYLDELSQTESELQTMPPRTAVARGLAELRVTDIPYV